MNEKFKDISISSFLEVLEELLRGMGTGKPGGS